MRYKYALFLSTSVWKGFLKHTIVVWEAMRERKLNLAWSEWRHGGLQNVGIPGGRAPENKEGPFTRRTPRLYARRDGLSPPQPRGKGTSSLTTHTTSPAETVGWGRGCCVPSHPVSWRRRRLIYDFHCCQIYQRKFFQWCTSMLKRVHFPAATGNCHDCHSLRSRQPKMTSPPPRLNV